MTQDTQNKTYLTTEGLTPPHALLIVLALATMGVSLYLTKYYFDTHFPEGLTTSSLCDISSFWTCGTATLSPMGEILSIPTSYFGLMFGLFIFAGSLFPSRNMENTNKVISYINLVACVLLFFYSLFTLGTLCPLCTVYYLLSGAIAFLYFRYNPVQLKDLRPSLKVIGAFAGVFILGGGALAYNVQNKQEKMSKISDSLIQQFYSLPNLGDPDIPWKHDIAKATEDFSQAPIRMSVFSDFQCPACKQFAEMVPQIVQKYQGKINLRYFFYPLDDACNKNMTRPLHPLACEAAYLAVCVPQKFVQVHDQIFEEQDDLTQKWIQAKATEHQALDCMKKEETHEVVKSAVELGDRYQLRSTPTIIINGVKIEGALPLQQFYIILDEILRRHQEQKS